MKNMFTKYPVGLRQGVIILLTLVFLFGNLNGIVNANRGIGFDLDDVVRANQTPIAYSQSFSIELEEAVEITLTGYDPDGDDLNFSIVQEPANGILIGDAPNLIYCPYMNFLGEDSFTFVVNDGTVDSEEAGVDIVVGLPSANTPPTANSQSITTQLEEAVEITLTGSDADGDDLRFWIRDSPMHGILIGTAPNLVYVPYMGFLGEDSFTFVTNDWIANSEEATVKVTVFLSVNHPPTASDQSLVMSEDVPLNITLSGRDEDGDTLRYFVLQNPSHGYLTGTAPDFIYTPYENFNGEDSFTYITNDWIANSEEALIDITIVPVNDQPTTQNLSKVTDENVPLTLTLIATDIDGDELEYAIVQSPTHGELTGTAPNLLYTPALDYTGVDSFTYKVSDGALDSEMATVTINVNPVVDGPVLDDQIIIVDEWVFIPKVPKLPRSLQYR